MTEINKVFLRIKNLKSLPNYVPGQIVHEGPVVSGGTPARRARRIIAILPPINDGQYRTTLKAYTPVTITFEQIAEQVEVESYPVERELNESFIEDPSMRGKKGDYEEDENGIRAWHRIGNEVEIFEGKTVRQIQNQLKPSSSGLAEAEQGAQSVWNQSEPQMAPNTAVNQTNPEPQPVGLAASSSSTDEDNRLADLKKWIPDLK